MQCVVGSVQSTHGNLGTGERDCKSVCAGVIFATIHPATINTYSWPLFLSNPPPPIFYLSVHHLMVVVARC